MVEEGEECDDGNRNGGDGCTFDCRIEECGNGVLEIGEGCDDGNDDDSIRHTNNNACDNDGDNDVVDDDGNDGKGNGDGKDDDDDGDGDDGGGGRIPGWGT